MTDARPRAQTSEGLDDERKAVGQVVTWPAVKLHPLAFFAVDHPEAVDVQPRPWANRQREDLASFAAVHKIPTRSERSGHGNGFAARFEPYQRPRLSRYNVGR